MLLAQTSVEFRLLLRRGESILVTLVVPPALLVFFGAVVPLPSHAESGRPVDVLLPGVLALAVMSTAMVSLGISAAFERHYGVLKRLGGTPLPRSVLLAAKMLSVLAIEVLQVVLLLAIALLLGWRPAGEALLAGAALLLGTAAFGGIGLWMAGSWRAEAALAGANALYLLLLLLGGIFVPVSSLPGPLAAVASLLPSAALADVLRYALLPGAAAPNLFPALAVLVAWAILTPLLAALTFRWE
ncbi:MAG: ABC transporter permease [Chloroflexi bacterium]|nr:ABC transporter permease [Chloroflexota bacterium]